MFTTALGSIFAAVGIDGIAASLLTVFIMFFGIFALGLGFDFLTRRLSRVLRVRDLERRGFDIDRAGRMFSEAIERTERNKRPRRRAKQII